MWNRQIEFIDDILPVRDILRILQCELSAGELEDFAEELVMGLRMDEFDFEE
jgi:hypothetical protein